MHATSGDIHTWKDIAPLLSGQGMNKSQAFQCRSLHYLEQGVQPDAKGVEMAMRILIHRLHYRCICNTSKLASGSLSFIKGPKSRQYRYCALMHWLRVMWGFKLKDEELASQLSAA